MKRISVESILVMFLFILFTASMGLLIVEGQDSYEAIIKNKNETEDMRIAYSYISKKIKQNDIVGNIEVVANPYNDHMGLAIKLYGVEEGYMTYIFYDEEGLYELLASEDEVIDKNLGELILKLSEPLSFEFDSEYSLINIKSESYEDVSIKILKEVVDHEK